jgi:CspA family cold shock protein
MNMKKLILGLTLASAFFTSLPIMTYAANDNQNVSMSDHNATMHGTVKWFDKQSGFGFITAQSGEEVFVHFSAIQTTNKDAPKALVQGQQVDFIAKPGKNGLQATSVTPR